MRKKIIAGNWKMNVKPSETAALIKAVAEATAQYGDKVEERVVLVGFGIGPGLEAGIRQLSFALGGKGP